MRRATYIFVAVALMSCARSEVPTIEVENHTMIFEPTVDDSSTRGTIVNPDDFTSDGQTFHLYATATSNIYDESGSFVYDTYPVAKADIEYSGTSWVPTDGNKIYWPTSASDVTFYAWYPATITPKKFDTNCIIIACDTYAGTTDETNEITLYKEGNDMINKTSEGTKGLQEDIMTCITTKSNPTMESVKDGEPNYTVSLNFSHVYTNLKFKYKTRDNISVRIKAMTLHNVDSKCGFYNWSSTSYEWAKYNSEYYSEYSNTKPNYHCVPITWSSAAEYVSSTTDAIDLDGDNDLMIIPQEVSAWNPTEATNYSPAANDGFTNSYYGYQHTYLRIYCDIKVDGTLAWGDDKLPLESDTELDMPSGHCMYVPLSSDKLWIAGKTVTYTLVFGSGYDENGELITLDTTPTPTPIVVTASLSDWDKGDDSNIEF